MILSIIIPVYNSSTSIIESMDSVMRECVVNSHSWELILVNDGSTDNSQTIIEEYIKKSSQQQYIRLINQENGGAAVARNTGIKNSIGEFLAFNDSDDRWLPGKLKLQMDYLLQNIDVVMVAGVFDIDNISKIKKINTPSIITIKDQVLKNYFSPPCTIIRKSILEKSGLFHEKMRYAEEGYFFNNIVYYGKSVLLPTVVTMPIIKKGRWGDSGLSGSIVKMEQGELFNITSAYRLGYISILLYIFAVCFSLAKFCRRWIVSKYRKIWR